VHAPLKPEPSPACAGPRGGHGPRCRVSTRALSAATLVGCLLGVWLAAGVASARPTPSLHPVRSLPGPGVSLGIAATSLAASAPEPDPAPVAGDPPEDDVERRTESKLLRSRSVPRCGSTASTTPTAPGPSPFRRCSSTASQARAPREAAPRRSVADLRVVSESAQRRRWINPAALFFGGFSERKTVWGALPLLMGYRRVGEQFNFGQFPLVWWWGTKFVKNFLVVPFHYQQKSPDGFRAVSALLLWYGHKNLDDANLENDRRHFVAAPVFWRFQRGLKRFDFGFLYIGGKNELEGRTYTAVTPLFLRHTSEFGNRNELWTIPWIRRRDEARGQSAWAVPLALTFRTRDPDRSLLSATPLFWRAKNQLRGSTFTLAGPVGHYDDPEQRNSFAAPLWFRFHDKDASATTQFLVPLLLTRKTPEKTAVWTVLGGGRKTTRGFGFAVPPALTFGVRRDDGRRLGSIAGVLWHSYRPQSEDRPGRSLWVAGPVGYVDRRTDGTKVGLPPLLTFGGREGTKTYQVITPLLWHVRDRDPAVDRRTLVTGPFYHHRTRAGFDGGLAPIAFWGRNAERATRSCRGSCSATSRTFAPRPR
jgi:hypothetical protein